MNDTDVEEMALRLLLNQELVEWCFMHFYGLDVSNAAVHCAEVRFSPITFRLQEALNAAWGHVSTLEIINDVDPEDAVSLAWHHVFQHNGEYAEDTGR